MAGYASLILLRHGFRRVRGVATAPQQGHLVVALVSALIKRARIVAIEFGT
jgi:hypothetical protein